MSATVHALLQSRRVYSVILSDDCEIYSRRRSSALTCADWQRCSLPQLRVSVVTLLLVNGHLTSATATGSPKKLFRS